MFLFKMIHLITREFSIFSFLTRNKFRLPRSECSVAFVRTDGEKWLYKTEMWIFPLRDHNNKIISLASKSAERLTPDVMLCHGCQACSTVGTRTILRTYVRTYQYYNQYVRTYVPRLLTTSSSSLSLLSSLSLAFASRIHNCFFLAKSDLLSYVLVREPKPPRACSLMESGARLLK